MKWFSTFQATVDRAPVAPPKKKIHLPSVLTGEAEALVDGYGCNGDLYVSSLNRLQELFGNPKRILTEFLEKLFKAPNLAHPESYTQFSSFLLTMVDTFSQLDFIHDLHSTINLNVALAKLPKPVLFEWKKFVLEKNYQQRSLQTLSEWLLDFSKACNELSPIDHLTQNNFKTPGKPTFFSGYNNATNDKENSYQRQFRSNASDYSHSENKQTAIKPCPNNKNCQFLYRCMVFQSLPPSIRRDHIRKLELGFNCFGSHHVDKCTSKNVCRNNNCGKKHHTLLQDIVSI